MAFFEVKNIRKSFGSTSVLNGVDLSLEKGQVMSIIGSSGSGKTTLLRCLNNLETADAGEVWVDGELRFAAGKYNNTTQSFGLVFQSFNLFPQYTAIGNLTLAPMLKAKNTAKKQKKSHAWLKQEYEKIEANAVELLASVGLLDKLNFYPCQLSGGQQQRVSIAR